MFHASLRHAVLRFRFHVAADIAEFTLAATIFFFR